ncbi:leucine carboxyl methyltransferase [Xylariaceae sp. FL1651]|nr:leucine carboxyl methyltransferase [Xylariaceae sp. FL1651]
MNAPPSTNPGRLLARSAKQRAQDDQVMQTNSSSIVSKRSVERIYYPDEPHYFRYFVKKFQRRAPLINRGYFLRLHVIDVAVRRFLDRSSDKTKVVVNLGCGSDVLPWQCMTRYPDACRYAKFVDIDFPDLMEKKCAIVLNTPELSSVFAPLNPDVSEHVLLKSDMYFQIGCDLRNTAGIEKALSTCLNIPDCIFMFVAEVSITYMETKGANEVIQWASSLGEAEFCLLEQILPDGPDHPFAKTMLSHFEKLKSPLKSVIEYPSLGAQNYRFSLLGWSYVKAQSLWQIWTNNEWISASKRQDVDNVEPFDEWEEFILFASHYCVVIARNFALHTESGDVDRVAAVERPAELPPPELFFSADVGSHGKRRFGSAVKMQNRLGEQIFANTFGLGTNNRLQSCDLHAFKLPALEMNMHPFGPGSRLCHAIVDLGYYGSILVGGRASPTTALRDCWHFSTEQNKWSPTDNLPVPLYRQAMTRLGQSNMVLLIGGKSDSSALFTGCLLYKPGSGWTQCSISSSVYRPVFGAMLVSFKEHSFIDYDTDSISIQFKGILAGGLLDDGTVSNQLLRWSLKLPANGRPTISFELLTPEPFSEKETETGSAYSGLLACRFGASAIPLDNRHIAVVGGVMHDGIVSREDEILIIDASGPSLQVLARYCISSCRSSSSAPRPLLVGTSVSLADTGQLILMGGGATCFSMGTYWNEGCYTSECDLRSLVCDRPSTTSLSPLRFCKLIEIRDVPLPFKEARAADSKTQRAKIISIPRVRIDTDDAFEEVLKAGKPVIIEGSDLGTCVHTWTAEYLRNKVGSEKKVVVHETTSTTMDFNSKNFSYTTQDFASFMTNAEKGGKQYLRALSEERPSDQPANLEADFPELANDFRLPPELSFVRRNLFSSVLRISGRVKMWLHYDVMANVYCQILGSKRLLLFPPEDVSYLSFAPGASSSSIDVLSELESPALAFTHPQEATLGPGDVLFIPPVWLHATEPLTDFGVAVNVFFRNLETGYSTGRDVYGNRDIAAYEKGRQDVARITHSFSKLPTDMQVFYMRRLADELSRNII